MLFSNKKEQTTGTRSNEDLSDLKGIMVNEERTFVIAFVDSLYRAVFSPSLRSAFM